MSLGELEDLSYRCRRLFRLAKEFVLLANKMADEVSESDKPINAWTVGDQSLH